MLERLRVIGLGILFIVAVSEINKQSQECSRVNFVLTNDSQAYCLLKNRPWGEKWGAFHKLPARETYQSTVSGNNLSLAISVSRSLSLSSSGTTAVHVAMCLTLTLRQRELITWDLWASNEVILSSLSSLPPAECYTSERCLHEPPYLLSTTVCGKAQQFIWCKKKNCMLL